MPSHEGKRTFEIHHMNGRGIVDPHNHSNLEILTWWEHYLRHYLPTFA